MMREPAAAVDPSGPPPPPSPFLFNRSAGQCWLREETPRSAAAEAALRASGFALGCSVANRCALPLRLPRVLFVKLLEEGSTQRPFVPTLALLEEFDPDAAKARGARQRDGGLARASEPEALLSV